MYKAAVLGDKDSIYGFAALGLDIFPADTLEQATEIFKKLSGGIYAVIYITESLAALLQEEIDKLAFKELPAVILIPGVTGNTGAGLKSVSKAVEKAVGSDIIK